MAASFVKAGYTRLIDAIKEYGSALQGDVWANYPPPELEEWYEAAQGVDSDVRPHQLDWSPKQLELFNRLLAVLDTGEITIEWKNPGTGEQNKIDANRWMLKMGLRWVQDCVRRLDYRDDETDESPSADGKLAALYIETPRFETFMRRTRLEQGARDLIGRELPSGDHAKRHLAEELLRLFFSTMERSDPDTNRDETHDWLKTTMGYELPDNEYDAIRTCVIKEDPQFKKWSTPGPKPSR